MQDMRNHIQTLPLVNVQTCVLQLPYWARSPKEEQSSCYSMKFVECNRTFLILCNLNNPSPCLSTIAKMPNAKFSQNTRDTPMVQLCRHRPAHIAIEYSMKAAQPSGATYTLAKTWAAQDRTPLFKKQLGLTLPSNCELSVYMNFKWL